MTRKKPNPPPVDAVKPEPPAAPPERHPVERFQEALEAWQKMGHEVVIPLAKEVFGSTSKFTHVLQDRVTDSAIEAANIALDGAPEEPQERCSFCNKSRRLVQHLIAGPAVMMCNECIDVSTDIIEEARAAGPTRP